MPLKFYIIFIILFGHLFTLTSLAQSGVADLSSPRSGSNKLKKEVINFDDELIEGGAQKPDLFYMFQKKNINYNKLIKLREDFLPEMRKSAEDVRRLRGGN